MSYEYDENNDSYSIRRGITIFLFLFILSVVVGSIVNRMLSGPRLKAVIAAKLQKSAPEIEFDLGHAKVLLSDGIMPMIGVSVDSLIVRKVEECGKRLHLRFEGLVLPFHVFDLLLSGHFKIGEVEIKKLVVYEVPQIVQRCEQTHNALQGMSAQGSTGHHSQASVPSFQVHEPAQPVPLDSLSVSEVVILNKNGDPALSLLSLRAQQSESGLVLKTGLLPTSERRHLVPLQLEVELMDRYDKARLDLRWREGRAQGTLNALKTRDVHGDLTISKMPLSEMYKMSRHLKLVQDERDMGANWLDAKIAWNGSSEKIKIQDASISGDIGKISTSNFEIQYGQKVTVSPFKAKLEPLRTDEVLRVLKIDEIQRLFVTSGEVNGNFEYINNQMSLEGTLTKSSAVFSREGRRASLRILRADFSTQYEVGSVVRGKISDIEIERGKWVGGITWQHKLSEAFTDFDLQFQGLVLPAQLTEPLFSVRLGELKGMVVVKLDHGKIKDMQMQSEIESAEGANFKSGVAKLRAVYQNGKAEGRMSLDRLTISSNLATFAMLSDERGADIQFQKFEGRLSYDSDVLDIGPLEFKGPVSAGELAGKWNTGRFNGTLVLRRVGNEKKYLISGPIESLGLTEQ